MKPNPEDMEDGQPHEGATGDARGAAGGAGGPSSSGRCRSFREAEKWNEVYLIRYALLLVK